jgi:hypothetical protein
MVVYHHFRSEGLRIKSGFNYGGHFVLYDGSPEEFHSKYLVYIILSEENQDTEVSWHTIQVYDPLKCTTTRATGISLIMSDRRLHVSQKMSRRQCYYVK